MKKWDIRKIRKKMVEWTQRPQNKELLFDSEVRDIQQRIQSGDPGQMVYVGASLEFISTWENTNGALAVLLGNPDGWRQLSKGAIYHFWGQRIVLHFYDVDTRRPKPARESYNKGSLCFAQLLALNYVGEADWLGERLVRGLSDGAFIKWFPEAQFNPFMICLHRLWKNEPPEEGLPPGTNLDAYRELLASWHDEGDSFKKGLQQACDYHMQRIDANKDDHEFWDDVFAGFPVDILAIKRIRKLAGLETPEVSHPLMETPLASPPEEILFVSDDLLDTVQRHLPAELIP